MKWNIKTILTIYLLELHYINEMPSIIFVRYTHSQDIDTIFLQIDLHFNQ